MLPFLCGASHYLQEETVFGDSAPAGEEGKQQRNATFKRLDEARVRNAREVRAFLIPAIGNTRRGHTSYAGD